jgi:multidrug efflux pump subunit AcrA (membrane-fusion protein)
VTVTVVTASPQPLRRTMDVGGVVRARATATVASRIVATVVGRPVAAGDRVKAGQPLVRLDSRDLDAGLERADAAQRAAQQALRVAEADRAAAAAAAALARASHARIARLHEARSATPHELDSAVEALRASDAREASAEAQVAASEAALEAGRAAAAAARVAASHATLTAPFDGLVTETLVDPGDLATPGVPLVRVEDTRAFRLEVPVDESWIGFVGDGQTVDVSFDAAADGEAAVSGTVVEIGRSVDPASHSFVVRIELAPSPRLRSGLFARARFEGPARQALVVPRDAVVVRGELPTVFVVASGVARERMLRTSDAGGAIEVTAGLSPGEQVIAAPPAALRDGDPVQPVGVTP